jgi:hypothetical protein
MNRKQKLVAFVAAFLVLAFVVSASYFLVWEPLIKPLIRPAEAAFIDEDLTSSDTAVESAGEDSQEVEVDEGQFQQLQNEERTITYTIKFVSDYCPPIYQIIGGEEDDWRRIDTYFNDVISTDEDGCGWRLFDFANQDLVLNIPEGIVLNKPPGTHGPAVIRTIFEPATLWLLDLEELEVCPQVTDLAVGTQEDDWNRIDINEDGLFDIEDDGCGWVLTFNDEKDLTFEIPEGVRVDQSEEVKNVRGFHTNRLEVSVWIMDDYYDTYLVR